MKLNVHHEGLLRIPKFSIEAELADHWEVLKSAIEYASPNFYTQIKEVKAVDLDKVPKDIYCSIWKYFNRSKYRGTPYGSFASVANFNFQPNKNGPIILDGQQKLHQFKDWSYSDQIDLSIDSLQWRHLAFVSNSSAYLIGNQLRFLCINQGKYFIREVDMSPTISVLLHSCKKPIKLLDLIHQLKNQGYQSNHLKKNVLELISLGLLFSSNQPNIIGQDYFKRIGISFKKPIKKYILAERKVLKGGPTLQDFKEIPKAIHCLRHLIQPVKSQALTSFIQKFQHKFEYAEIPILEALDPEIGIGYLNLEHGLAETDVHQLSLTMDKIKNSEVFLKNALLPYMNSSSTSVIQLEQIDIQENNDLPPVPNSMTALLSLSSDLIHLEAVGGCTANALLGRFTLVNNKIKNTCHSIAKIEQLANPDVLFFDVAYTAEKHLDNINRRKRIYDHQLSILGYDTSRSPLEFSDLFLFVHDGALILRSKKLQKRLIPRVASAYNHHRSELSVFRLLCDLQHQGLQSDLNLDLQSIFPDCASYPRIQYCNIVISPAKWRIGLNQIPDCSLSIANLQKHLEEKGVPRYFKCGQADQMLRFDRLQQNDLLVFKQLLKKLNTIYIEEAFQFKSNYLQDQQQRNFHAQFQVSLTHNQELYTAIKPHYPFYAKKTHPKSPGGKWLYFELYCHPQRADTLLQHQLSTFLKTYNRKISKWFFIRYTENGHHLRLRLQLKNKKYGFDLISAMSQVLKKDLKAGTISDLRLRSYKKEISRYGKKNMSQVEQHFTEDSQFALALLDLKLTTYEKYRLCEKFIYAIESSNLLKPLNIKMLIAGLSNDLNAEQGLNGKAFAALNKNYKAYEFIKHPELKGQSLTLFKVLKHSFIETISHYRVEKRFHLMTDLIHMQFNRLFSSEQRLQELTFYYYLSKDFKSNYFREQSKPPNS